MMRPGLGIFGAVGVNRPKLRMELDRKGWIPYTLQQARILFRYPQGFRPVRACNVDTPQGYYQRDQRLFIVYLAGQRLRWLEILFDFLGAQAIQSAQRYMEGEAESEFLSVALWGRRDVRQEP
jgi:hypothetical protein